MFDSGSVQGLSSLVTARSERIGRSLTLRDRRWYEQVLATQGLPSLRAAQEDSGHGRNRQGQEVGPSERVHPPGRDKGAHTRSVDAEDVAGCKAVIRTPVAMSGGAGEISTPAPSTASDNDNGVRIIHTVGMTAAATTRTSLDLLTLSFPFSQVELLTADEFLKAADERRIRMWGDHRLDVTGLEELHRCRVVVPLFCVHLGDEDPTRRIDTTGSVTRERVRRTTISQLYRAAEDGRLTDPWVEPFEPWPTDRVQTLWPSVERGYLYSYHQLLGFERARSIVRALRPLEKSTPGWIWRLPDADLPGEFAADGIESWQSLAITLCAIDWRNWPYITHVVHHSDDVWRAARLEQSPKDLVEWLELTVDDLREQSERLRVSASFDDVLGDFYDLVRRSNPEAWTTLRGDARTAMDSRMAAEALDRFAGEVEGKEPGPPPAPTTHLSMQRLGERGKSLDATLNELHVSPHPPLVIAIEGATEWKLIPRVMETLGMTIDPTWIRLVEFEGTKDLSLVARFAAEPIIGDDRGDFVLLDRPVTRFLVLTDAENKFKTLANRAHQRRVLINSIAGRLPADLRPDLYLPTAQIVEIMTWGKLPFEFAHFSNRVLADAMESVAAFPHPTGRADLLRAIEMQRTRDPTPDIEDAAWNRSRITKVRLADALWPRLEARIERAIAAQTTGPPVMKAMLRAHELAMLSYRLHMSLRRHS